MSTHNLKLLFIKQNIAKRILSLRRKHKLTLEEMAYLTGVGKSTLYRAEHCHHTATTSTLLKIAAAFRLHHKDLI